MRVLLIFILFIPELLFSQGRGQWSGSGNSSDFQVLMTVKGNLIDSETNEALSFATISIKTIDSILISGGISDENGRLLFPENGCNV